MKLFNEGWVKDSLNKYKFSYTVENGGHDVFLIVKEMKIFEFNKLKDLIDFVRYNNNILTKLSTYTEKDLEILLKRIDIGLADYDIYNLLRTRYNIDSGLATVDITKHIDGTDSYIFASDRPILLYNNFSYYDNGEVKIPSMVLPIYNKEKFLKMNFDKIVKFKF
jgi:hypothetical protein